MRVQETEASSHVRGHGLPAQPGSPRPLPTRRGTVNHTPSLQLCFYLWNNSGLRIQPKLFGVFPFLSVPVSYLGPTHPSPWETSGVFPSSADLQPAGHVHLLLTSSSGSRPHRGSQLLLAFVAGEDSSFPRPRQVGQISEHAQSIPEPKTQPSPQLTHSSSKQVDESPL